MVVRFLAASSCRRILFSLNHLMLRFIRRVRREMNLRFRVLSVFFVLFSVVLEEQVEEKAAAPASESPKEVDSEKAAVQKRIKGCLFTVTPSERVAVTDRLPN